jgi:hypothetical protein
MKLSLASVPSSDSNSPMFSAPIRPVRLKTNFPIADLVGNPYLCGFNHTSGYRNRYAILKVLKINQIEVMLTCDFRKFAKVATTDLEGVR